MPNLLPLIRRHIIFAMCGIAFAGAVLSCRHAIANEPTPNNTGVFSLPSSFRQELAVLRKIGASEIPR